MTVSINDVRTVPVGEDLTKDDLTCNVLRGLEKMHRVDKALAASNTVLLKGEWAVLNASGKAARPSATPVPNTYLVWCGTDRYDVRATGQVTLLMASQLLAQTTRYDNTQTYAPGDYLTVKDRGGGQADVTKATGTEPKLAKVVEVGTGYLVYETLSN